MLNENPEYSKALTYSSYDQDNRRTLREVMLTVAGSPRCRNPGGKENMM